MNKVYGRDLDLNLLRVFVVAAEVGSVTAAASRLYVTQPAVSAALRRLTTAVGGPLFAREGRGLALTARGARLLSAARPALEALVTSALSPGAFDPKTSERVVRLGLSDTQESWLLPPLLATLTRDAPGIQLVVLPVQFRTVEGALRTGSVDLAVTVADELPKSILRAKLFTAGFTCIYDSLYANIGGKLTLSRYLEHEHVVVSYNGDLRGVVEDILGYQRKVRVSVPGFQSIGNIVEGSALLATVPSIVAREVLLRHPGLSTTALPFVFEGTGTELLWRRAADDDPALAFLRDHVVRIANTLHAPSGARKRKGQP